MDSNKAIKKIVDEMMGYFGLEERAREPLNAWSKMIYGLGFQDGNTHPTTKHKHKPVIQMNREGHHIQVFESLRIASRITRVDVAHISKCCLGQAITAGGFKWKFLNEEDYYKYRQVK